MRALLPFLTLMIAPALAAPPYMIGTWFGTGQPHDRSSMYIDRMTPNGSWRGEYRTCVKGKAEDLVQQGSWSLNGDILTLKVQRVNDFPTLRIDTYKMLEHSSTAQKYIELPLNFPYTPKRVADDFKMPPCDLVS
jgi:hypothetical protein